MKKLSMIASVSNDLGLGYENQLLWHFKTDMQFFRATTTGHAVVMGSKTFFSIKKPLPNRRNIVLSRQNLDAKGIEVCKSRDELDELLSKIDDEIFIIGGASLYQMFIDEADTIYLTEVKAKKPADVFFPKFNQTDFEREILQSSEDNDIIFDIIKYSRKVKK